MLRGPRHGQDRAFFVLFCFVFSVFKYVYIWLCWVLVEAREILSCGMLTFVAACGT